MQFKYLNLIRETNPLVHCITNIVVANYTANGLLALGASPLMSANVAEMDEIPAFSQALLLNIGTLNGTDAEAMLAAGKRANQAGIPVVLDPVGVGATSYRKNVVNRLLSEVRFALIRGNAGEIAALAERDWQAKGVDAGSGAADMREAAKFVAQKYGCIVALSGETDWISDGARLVGVHNGTPLFPRITGSGCLLGAVCAAFLGVADKRDYFAACVEACTFYAAAGETAAETLLPTQTGTFSTALLDQLAAMTAQQAEEKARVSDE
ncbi:hydroxyethylthiazole kinase [Caviibacterium pharyngocola]|uniref:Hydroxyethylthiazole kinase n=1 Tax=Caviibacterium pharyngocola TaxID=28159 RepID=A0A2M8RX15_9PAST|nr:hydroxyethylthiazole kinase [Caviibacterium pharyngocola]PJG83421.1 hydroxyethylthiazole kinase [Caviibacterium pharyngocola]